MLVLLLLLLLLLLVEKGDGAVELADEDDAAAEEDEDEDDGIPWMSRAGLAAEAAWAAMPWKAIPRGLPFLSSSIMPPLVSMSISKDMTSPLSQGTLLLDEPPPPPPPPDSLLVPEELPAALP